MTQELVGSAGTPRETAVCLDAPASKWRRAGEALRWALPLVVAGAVAGASRPEGVSPAGWATTAIFLATMLAFALWPFPPAVVVLGAVSALAIVSPDGPKQAFVGYGTASIWLVLGAMIVSRALQDSGLARRIALRLVRSFGSTSFGLAVALVLGDLLLAAVVPSVTARTAGVILPVGIGLAELHDSRPGSSASRLGRFLIAALYQCSGVACALFLTGQAGNALAASLARERFGVVMGWTNWFVAASLPAVVSCGAIIVLVHRLARPTIVRTPAVRAHADRELAALGSMTRREIITLVVTVCACALFATGSLHHVELVVVAVLAGLVLVASGVVRWATVVGERTFWDTFVWYGGLVSLADALATSGSPAALARLAGRATGELAPLLVFVVAMLLAFFAHYLFASITTMILALFVPFVLVLTRSGVSPALACFGIVFAFNLSTGLTQYGSTHGPILFAADYASLRTWWRIGALAGALNLVVWLAVGLPWWKAIGLW